MTLRIDSYRQVVTATITTLTTESAAVDIGGYGVSAIVMSTAWTAASISFMASPDGTTYRDLYNDTGAEVAITGTANAVIALPTSMAQLVGANRYLKVRSGLTAALVAQTTDRNLTLVLEPRV